MFAKKHNMDWDDLRHFLAVAEHGSLSGASRELEVNHSTVFRRINRLEEKSSVRLFERLPDGYHLTQAGEEMRNHAEKIRNEVDALSLRIIGKDVQPAGVVRVTAPDSLAYRFINRYLVEFCERFPGIDVELIVSNRDLDLTRRETDIAIRATTKPPQHLIGRKIFSLYWAFYAMESYLKKYGVPESTDDLEEHVFVGPDGNVARLPAFVIFEKKYRPTYRVRGNNLMAIAALASAGNGIALLPDDQVHSGMQRLFEMRPVTTSDIWALIHPELRATQRVKLLSDFLVESFRSDKLLAGLVQQ